MSWSTSELRVRLAPLNRFKPSSKIFYWPFQGSTSFVNLLCFCSVLCLLCLCARLFICALWSPAGKGLTSWLSFVVSAVSLSLSHWYPGSGVVLDCIDSWSLHPYLLCCWLFLPLWDSVIILCFVACYVHSSLTERAGCFAFSVILVSRGCRVALPHVAMGLFVVCDCGISWSYNVLSRWGNERKNTISKTINMLFLFELITNDYIPVCFCLFCCFTSQVNNYGHGETVSSPNHTFSWASLNKQLVSTSCSYFRL